MDVTPGQYSPSRAIRLTYWVWKTMRRRCTNPRAREYPRYGGRGIAVCDRWLHSFANFLADMGEKPAGLTIDRKNNDQGYSPDNCCWATRAQQMRNQSRTKLTMIAVDEIRSLSASGWTQSYLAEMYGVVPSHISGIVNGHNWRTDESTARTERRERGT